MTAIRYQFFRVFFSVLIGFFLVESAFSAPDREGWASHWSFQKLNRPIVPQKGNAVDAFILEELEKNALKQNERADRHTLIRRITLDLTGLPPTRKEIADFVGDQSEES
ncbi:MAG: DUF1549 domain-containing protein, partial [Methylococcales bacterium]|nr:DUF1549 domain-containing protein [Methylococcales bacterium]